MTTPAETPLTPDKFKAQMLALTEYAEGDTEIMHCEMDDLMCKVLSSLGYHAGVQLFKNEPKWYA